MMADFWSQFEPVDDSGMTRTFDPSQASANTGINGGGGASSLPYFGTWSDPNIRPPGRITPTGPEWRWSPSNPGGYGGPNATPATGAIIPDMTIRPDSGLPYWRPDAPFGSPDYVQQWNAHYNPNNLPFDPSQPQYAASGGGASPDLGDSLNTALNQVNQTAMGSPGGGQRWDQNYFVQNFGSPRTPQELVALESKITAAGGKVLRNAAGVAGKIQTPDGRIIDVINSAGAGGNGFQWLEGPGGGGGGTGGGTLQGLGYDFGASMAPWNDQFSAPDPNKITSDPYYQFQLGEGMKALQGSAAARGTLLTGGTLKGIAQYGQGLASAFGDKAYDRGLNEYLLRRENFYNNQDRPFDKNYKLATLGQTAAAAS